VYGYEIISQTGTMCLTISLLLTSVFFLANMVQYYFYGDSFDSHNWETLPIVSYETQNGIIVRTIVPGAYKDYIDNPEYKYKWIPSRTSMGFEKKAPPPECYVLCSPGMRLAVDEIISKQPKETYN